MPWSYGLNNGCFMVVGESFLDQDVEGSVARIAPDAPVPVLEEARTVVRPGAAAHAATWVARDAPHSHVVFVTALARDEGGRKLRAALEAEGVRIVDLKWSGRTTERIRLRGNGQPLLRLDRNSPRGRVVAGACPPDVASAPAAVLVSDYGQGLVNHGVLRARIAQLARQVPVVWDPHPLGGPPVPGVAAVTPNIAELQALHGGRFAPDLPAIASAASELLTQWQAGAVAVTMSERGVLLVTEGASRLIPAPKVTPIDACGAGDRLAAALTVRLSAGLDLQQASTGAVETAAAYVASDPVERVLGPGGVAGEESIPALVRRAQARGLRVVSTSGCFDVLHTGHTRFLEEARSRGDMLVVLLNSDESVRRLKGPARPVTAEGDRAAVLRSLSSVDAVMVFPEDTPVEVLRRLRPDLFVKGGDYTADALPERDVLTEIGAEVEILRYWPGYSTTNLIESLVR